MNGTSEKTPGDGSPDSKGVKGFEGTDDYLDDDREEVKDLMREGSSEELKGGIEKFDGKYKEDIEGVRTLLDKRADLYLKLKTREGEVRFDDLTGEAAQKALEIRDELDELDLEIADKKADSLRNFEYYISLVSKREGQPVDLEAEVETVRGDNEQDFEDYYDNLVKAREQRGEEEEPDLVKKFLEAHARDDQSVGEEGDEILEEARQKMEEKEEETRERREEEAAFIEGATREELQERFGERLTELQTKLNELEPYLPEERRGENLPSVFDFRNYPFPENVSKHEYAINQTIMDANIEMIERELESLRQDENGLSEQEKEKSILSTLEVIDKNMKGISESLQRSEFEQIELEKVELEVENKYRLLGHREGMIEVSEGIIKVLKEEIEELEEKPELFEARHEDVVEGKKFALEKWEEELELWEEDHKRLKDELDDLSVKYTDSYLEYGEDRGKLGQLSKDERDKELERHLSETRFTDAYYEGYYYSLSQGKKLGLKFEEVEETPEESKFRERVFGFLARTKLIKESVEGMITDSLGAFGKQVSKSLGKVDLGAEIEKGLRLVGDTVLERQESFKKKARGWFRSILKDIVKSISEFINEEK